MVAEADECAMANDGDLRSYTMKGHDVDLVTDSDKWAISPRGNTSPDTTASDHHLVEIPKDCSATNEEEDTTDLLDKLNNANIPEKATYVLAVMTVVLVTWTMASQQWLLPYLYTGYFVLLVPIRVWKYAKLKWMCFLCDWCYHANVVLLMFLWAAPSNSTYLTIVFALSNGPVAWSVVLFRNCLVPHSIDRMTNFFIHMLPPLVTHTIRWQTEEASTGWYRDFGVPSLVDLPFEWECVWLILVPIAIYMLHAVLYLAVFVCYIGAEYPNNYSYLVNDSAGCISKTVKKGGKCEYVVFTALQLSYAFVTISITWLFFHFRVAHVVFLLLLFTIATYNGSTFYLDLYPKKKLEADPYRLCTKS
ncbi:uncharacterized protein [Diadema antillarum]|uniref:uncharacterized protein n=1 Tax=Diadema antillarum TaxID=105358 RepID=UPI003A8757CF